MFGTATDNRTYRRRRFGLTEVLLVAGIFLLRSKKAH